jgi:hypothetical protein
MKNDPIIKILDSLNHEQAKCMFQILKDGQIKNRANLRARILGIYNKRCKGMKAQRPKEAVFIKNLLEIEANNLPIIGPLSQEQITNFLTSKKI